MSETIEQLVAIDLGNGYTSYKEWRLRLSGNRLQVVARVGGVVQSRGF